MYLRNDVVAVKTPLSINLPADWTQSLSGLLQSLKTSPHKRVDALLVAMADDFAGGVMLRWLLYLMPKSRRADGSIYKPATQLRAEIGLTKHQVSRINKILPRCGIEVTVKKAHGAPTNHYRLNGLKFLRRLSAVLSLPLPFLLMRLSQSGNGFTGKREMDLPENGKSLTIDSTIKTTNVVNESDSIPENIVDLPPSTPEQMRVIAMLVKAGLQNAQAVPFAPLPEATVQACINSTQKAVNEKRVSLQKRVGYLITALRNQKKAHTAPPPNPLPMEESKARYAVDELENTPASHSHPSSSAAPINAQAQQQWDSAYHQIELQFDRQTFDMWLRSARLVDFADGEFVVAVRNQTARDMCQHRLIRTITRILCDVTGQDVKVRFEADEQSAAPGQVLRRFLRTEN